jgi:hypothetical protein
VKSDPKIKFPASDEPNKRIRAVLASEIKVVTVEFETVGRDNELHDWCLRKATNTVALSQTFLLTSRKPAINWRKRPLRN